MTHNAITDVISKAIDTYQRTIAIKPVFEAVCSLNYIQGILSISAGIRLLQNKKQHQTGYTNLKGIINILSGVQICALTYNPAIVAACGISGGFALAPASYTLSLLCDLVNASIDYMHTMKVMTYSGWLEDSKREIAFIDKRLIKINDEIDQLVRISGKAKKGDPDLTCYSKYGNSNTLNMKLTKLTDTQKMLKKRVATIAAIKDESAWKPNTHLQLSLQKKKKRAILNVALSAAKFIGWAMIASALFVTCPPIQISGLVIALAATTAYIYENRDSIKKDLVSAKEYVTNKFNFFQRMNIPNTTYHTEKFAAPAIK